jgi:hypothetical protein
LGLDPDGAGTQAGLNYWPRPAQRLCPVLARASRRGGQCATGANRSSGPLQEQAAPLLTDHAAGDACAAAAQRRQLIGIIVATFVDHQRMAAELRDIADATRT